MKVLLQVLAQLAAHLDPSDLTSLRSLAVALLKAMVAYLEEQLLPTPMGSPAGASDSDLDEAIEHCQTAIVKFGGTVPMMAGGDRWEKLKQLLLTLLPLIL